MTSLAPLSLADALANTRAGTAGYWDASGAQAVEAAGVSRVDYDPATLAVRGLLLEEGRTNLLLNSATLSTQSVSVTAQAYTLSFYGTGTVTLSGASTAGPLAGTASTTRVSLTFTPSAGSLTLTVSGSVLYAQLEAGAYPTSWITTAGTSATRSRDAVTLNSPTDWLSDGVGTLLLEVLMPFTPPADGVLRRLVQIDDGTESNRISVYLSGANLTADMQSGGAAQVSATLGAVTANVAKKVAYAWSANDAAAVAAGNSLVADTSCTVPSVTTGRLGCASATGSDLSGYIRAVRFYPRRLTNNELTALVA